MRANITNFSPLKTTPVQLAKFSLKKTKHFGTVFKQHAALKPLKLMGWVHWNTVIILDKEYNLPLRLQP
jgi:hypothetical protein